MFPRLLTTTPRVFSRIIFACCDDGAAVMLSRLVVRAFIDTRVQAIPAAVAAERLDTRLFWFYLLEERALGESTITSDLPCWEDKLTRSRRELGDLLLLLESR